MNQEEIENECLLSPPSNLSSRKLKVLSVFALGGHDLMNTAPSTLLLTHN